jgi:hypothetical protein
MHEAIHVTGTKHEAAAELKWIFLDPMLPMPSSLGARTGLGVIAPEQMKKVRALQLCGAIGFAMLINEQWKINSGLLTELARKVGIAQTNGSQRGAPASDFFCVFAQLRDMLAAEDSTVMA